MTGKLPEFHATVLCEERGGLGLFRLDEDLTVETAAAGTITVPKGYVTDLATIPRPFRWLLPQAGRSAIPGAVHDYLCHLDDRRANAVFSELLHATGSGPIRRPLMCAFTFVFTWYKLRDPQKG